MDGSRFVTKDKYDYYEVISALQKDIRRGNEKEALFWALQLADGGQMSHLLNRLYVIVNEDVGIRDGGTTLILVDVLIKQTKEFYTQKNDAWYMSLSNIIMAMCRLKKTRESENYLTLVKEKIKNGWKPEIPDYALDMHTRKGKAMGRGLKFFVENESVPEHSKAGNDYLDDANQIELKLDT